MAGILICEADAIFRTIVQNKWWRLLSGTILPERSTGSFSGYTTAAVQLENAQATDSGCPSSLVGTPLAWLRPSSGR
jgi:hypothetical protein